jgi:hypothetical protein
MDRIEDESISFVYRSPYLDFLLLFFHFLAHYTVNSALHVCPRVFLGGTFDGVETAYDAMNGFFSYSSFPSLLFPISLPILVFSVCSP